MPGLEALAQQCGFTVIERRVFGVPSETVAALAAIALAKMSLDSLQQRSPAALLIPLLIIGIPLANVLGWLLARIFPTDDFMPLGYRLICTKAV